MFSALVSVTDLHTSLLHLCVNSFVVLAEYLLLGLTLNLTLPVRKIVFWRHLIGRLSKLHAAVRYRESRARQQSARIVPTVRTLGRLRSSDVYQAFTCTILRLDIQTHTQNEGEGWYVMSVTGVSSFEVQQRR
jgi:hypothetical protein